MSSGMGHCRRYLLATLLFALALWPAPQARADTATPPNPLAARAGWSIAATSAGIQRLTGSALAAAGVDLTNLDPTRLQLWLRGRAVPLEELGTEDGRLDPSDELRFYAPPPGDRWNSADNYWLSLEPVAGTRMIQRPAPAPATPSCSAVEERGSLGAPALYASLQPGPDGDHWFVATLSNAGVASAWSGGPISTNLPGASGEALLSVSGSSSGPGPHHLLINLGQASAEQRWEGTGDWHAELRVTREVGAAPPEVQLMAGADEADSLLIDQISWALPVALQLGGRQASFTALPAAGLCQISAPPAGAALYAISDPHAPARVALEPDGLLAPDTYVIVGGGDLHAPQVRPRNLADLAQLPRADQIYIAPAALSDALRPLVEQRRRQGLAVAVLDVQQIYDAWSGGAVDPQAIRAMLRWARATWQPPPQAVTLVGDGSSDPHDYTRRGTPNLIPPFLAMVDPYLGETACESCFAQLDGASPLDDPRPDILLGRLPVKSADELRSVVAKIVGYETAADGVGWRERALFLADNAVEANGRPDPAGDFAALAERTIGTMPPGMLSERIFYDPLAPADQPWRERNPVRAHQRTLATLRNGAGLVVYIGHSHYWQWASTDPTSPQPALLELLDVDTLNNAGRLPMVLSMSCLSSAFQHPSYSGTSIDELLLLHPAGGAIAVWGSTGLGVLTGHESLLRGFTAALWRNNGTAPVGALVLAGYDELLATQPCCTDSIWTFALLGDPLTPIRAAPAYHIWLPLVLRHNSN